MAIIDKKLIHFKTWNNFISPNGVNGNWEDPNTGTSEDDGTAIYGQIKGTSIVFIKDVGKIWTHGKLYNEDQYVSQIDDALPMPNSVGGISAGTTAGELKTKTYSQLLDDLLFPSVNPTHTNPSVSGFALSNTTTPVEIGSNVVGITAATLNRGKWSEYNDNAPYTGTASSTVYEITINGTKYTSITNLPATYTTTGNQTYKVTINYNAGVAPKNNKGVEVPSLAAPADSVTATRTINVTKPWYASTVTAGTLTKQTLVSWNNTAGQMSTGEFTLTSHTAATPQMIKTPRTITSMQMYNTVAKQFETVDFANWNVSGNDTDGYTYTFTGATRDSVKLIVKF